jgi:chemotaxis response regulator CheB
MDTIPQVPKFIIVAGASAGGINAMSEFVAQLHEDIDAAVL